MKRIEITEEVRRKAETSTPTNILCVSARDIIFIVDKLNEVIDALNARPKEISHEALVAFLAE